ncbi:GDP-mannose 4,6-dehydratase [Pseudoxanthomonas daejeonensis]|uniref:GDP-mannose 4,6-dehydratase n=1 Tax=Pseudoxanthomonas daejeonensis TaxID=266062 RepID=UPI001F53F704|nr:GDP-mannose 4,6-dehydratase [Pseudoxanthomonas daejeonensis]UNK56438.1 GDP-mannose 4,6-dehydratase [Pseudoxanthomonas daejeonensis]
MSSAASHPGGKLLLTGAGGFVGEHVLRAGAAGAFGRLQVEPLPRNVDIRDALAVREAIAEIRPDAVLHLAAQSFVPQSFDDPRETFEINLLGTLNLLDGLKRGGFGGRMVYVSSGDIYGRVADEELPVTEQTPVAPRSPYAVSKVSAEQLCMQWQRTEDIDVVIARPFNHIGPGQNPRFVVPSIASQVAAIAAGVKPPVLDVGDIDTTRDFTDVRDVVSAYAAILARGVSGRTYVVASGHERRVRELLEEMCVIAGVSPQIRQDPSKMRPAEQRRMVADASRLRSDTSWSPAISLERTLSDILQEAKDNL